MAASAQVALITDLATERGANEDVLGEESHLAGRRQLADPRSGLQTADVQTMSSHLRHFMSANRKSPHHLGRAGRNLLHKPDRQYCKELSTLPTL